LIDERRATPLRTTFDLRDAVAAVVPQHLLPATLSRVFQAFRIAVNDELSILEKTLTSLIPFLASGGRAVVISYHSLEDRIVKNIFADFAKTSIPDPDNPRSFHKSIEPIARLLTRKPQPPSPEELQRNPRARSAKLRILEKI
jgi:16S rRNA (cytosine1402-N4)-methyltransferase